MIAGHSSWAAAGDRVAIVWSRVVKHFTFDGTRRVTIARLALLLVAVLFLCISFGHGAEAKSARYSHFNADLTLQPDGVFHVRETQVVDFTGGPFVNGHRTIPTARTDGITNITVAAVEDGETIPFTETTLDKLADGADRYAVMQSPGTVLIYWTFPAVNDDS